MSADKRRTADRVLNFRLHVVGSHGPEATYDTRSAAEEEAERLRRNGLRVDVEPVAAPLPTNPWL